MFFSSGEYLQTVLARWKSTDIFERLNFVKKVLVEPSISTRVKTVMEEYEAGVASKRGACLFCVMCGNFSEGINFSDELARAVVIIGLPFSNPNTAYVSVSMNRNHLYKD